MGCRFGRFGRFFFSSQVFEGRRCPKLGGICHAASTRNWSLLIGQRGQGERREEIPAVLANCQKPIANCGSCATLTLMRKAAIVVSTLLLLIACHHGTKNLPSLFPADVSGWVRSGDVRTFEAANLWQYVDGGAEKFVSAGVRNTGTADYRYNGKFDAVADVHQFASAQGPKTIMDSEPSAGSQPVQIGEAGVMSAQTLEFRRGNYLVRIVAYDETPETKAALTALGQAIAAKL